MSKSWLFLQKKNPSSSQIVLNCLTSPLPPLILPQNLGVIGTSIIQKTCWSYTGTCLVSSWRGDLLQGLCILPWDPRWSKGSDLQWILRNVHSCPRNMHGYTQWILRNIHRNIQAIGLPTGVSSASPGRSFSPPLYPELLFKWGCQRSDLRELSAFKSHAAPLSMILLFTRTQKCH